LTLESTGRVFGPVAANPPTPIKFTAKLSDPSGASRLGVFRLKTLACPPGTLRFAMDRLSDARVGLDYVTNVEVLGGDATSTVFSVVTGSVVLNGTAQPNLETVGLRLFPDGTIAGRPLAAGTLAFTARATRNGALARNRTGTATDQPLTIKIEAIQSIQSILAIKSCNLRANTLRPGRDILTMTAFFNSDGLVSSDFARVNFVIRVGNKTFTTMLDGQGQSRLGALRVAIDAPTGILRVSVRGQDFSNLFDVSTLVDRSVKIVPIVVQIGDLFLGAATEEFSVGNRRGRIAMRYMLGRQRQVSGLFQLLSVKGRDDGSFGTAFKAIMLLSQVATVQGARFGDATDAVVNIGPKFTESLKLFHGRGLFFPPGVAAINVRGDRKVASIFTFDLTTDQTGIQNAASANGQIQTFLLGLKVTTSTLTFNGEASRRIFPF
jgi:hypothetical protein